ncbi:MAG: hypothetical protein KGK08_08725 [Acidobacteriota bacterium]|nr:hypothetical protein [Acidobacteriota bacterium]
MSRRKHWIYGMVLVALVGTTGCRVDADDHGDSKNVRISTPFGGVQVKTNDAAVQEGTGLPAYPGATVVRKDKDSGAADIDLSFGEFRLRVKAVSYHSDDAPEKVAAFYRNALQRFGDVITCQHGVAVGQPSHTAEGLTCQQTHDEHVKVTDDFSGRLELKAGSEKHQHMVELDADGSGTRFGLVALDLPAHLVVEDGKDQHMQ